MKITEAARQAAPPELSEFLFEPNMADECSVSDDLVATLKEKKATWNNQAALPTRLGAVRWMCAMEAQGSYARIEEAWPSLLAEAGLVLQLLDAGGPGMLVLRSSGFGFLYVTVEIHRLENPKRYVIQFPRHDRSIFGHKVWTMRDLAQYNACEVQPMTPGHPSHDADAVWSGLQLALVRPESLERKAARTGFKGMTLVHLKKLFNYFRDNVAGFDKEKRPRTVVEFVAALVQHLFPKMSPAERSDCVARRDTGEPSPDADAGDLSVVAGILPAVLEEIGDEDQAQKVLEEQRRRPNAQAAAARARMAADKACGVGVPVETPLSPILFVRGRGLRQPEAKKSARVNFL